MKGGPDGANQHIIFVKMQLIPSKIFGLGPLFVKNGL